MTTDKASQEKIERLQAYEQTVQGHVAQKQNLQSQLIEVDSALAELEKTKKAFKIVGGIMVEALPATLTEEILGKKELLTMRISAIEKQEKQLREKIKSTQEDVVKSLKGNKNDDN